MRKVLGRIHIPVGLFLLAFATAAIAQDFNHHAAELAVAPPLKLVSAQTKDHHWRTSLFLTPLPNASAPAKIHVDEGGGACPSPEVTIAPNGAAILRDVALTQFCGAQDIQLFPPPAGADSFTVLSFDDGKTQSSFDLPPIGAITSSQRFGPIVSDDYEGTWINTFPTKPTPLSVEVYDGSGKKIATELYEANPPVDQYRLKTNVSIGFVVITGWPGFPLTAPLYGFANSGTPRGGNLRAFPFGE
jgi:hypothetical protein